MLLNYFENAYIKESFRTIKYLKKHVAYISLNDKKLWYSR